MKLVQLCSNKYFITAINHIVHHRIIFEHRLWCNIWEHQNFRRLTTVRNRLFSCQLVARCICHQRCCFSWNKIPTDVLWHQNDLEAVDRRSAHRTCPSCAHIWTESSFLFKRIFGPGRDSWLPSASELYGRRHRVFRPSHSWHQSHVSKCFDQKGLQSASLRPRRNFRMFIDNRSHVHRRSMRCDFVGLPNSQGQTSSMDFLGIGIGCNNLLLDFVFCWWRNHSDQ